MNLANVTIGSDLPAFLNPPDGPSKIPVGLVVIQEWWGLNSWMQQITKQFSTTLGIHALCPDLYRGKVAQNEREAGHLMGHMDWDQAIQDIQAAVNYLKDVKKCKKVAVLGFCVGGALSIAAGVHCTNVDGIVGFYGIPKPDIADPKNLKCPKTQFHFGMLDDSKGFSDPQSADQLERTLQESKISAEFYRYPDCKHAFMNQQRPNFNQAAFDLAMERVCTFLKKL